MTHHVVSFSSPSLPSDCQSVVEAIRETGLVGDVTCNQTIDSRGRCERGCRAFVADSTLCDVQRFFRAVQRVHPDVECAHVRSVSNVTEGCIWNVTGCVSNCPQYRRRRCEQQNR